MSDLPATHILDTAVPAYVQLIHPVMAVPAISAISEAESSTPSMTTAVPATNQQPAPGESSLGDNSAANNLVTAVPATAKEPFTLFL